MINILTIYDNSLLLEALPFNRWSEVIHEAQNWGLLSPDPEIPSFLRLQPIFPYFLRNRLYAPEQGEVRSAVRQRSVSNMTS